MMNGDTMKNHIETAIKVKQYIACNDIVKEISHLHSLSILRL